MAGSTATGLRVLVGALVWTAASAPALTVRAAEVSFIAAVDRNEIGVGETLTLTLSTSVPDLKRIEKLQTPDTGALEIESTSERQSTTFSFAGGNQDFKRVRHTVLVLRATKEGSTTIGSALLHYAGKTYKTDPIAVRVVKEPTRAPRKGRRVSPFFDDDFFRSPFDDMMDSRREIDADDIFIEASATPEMVSEGQQVTVSVVVYTRISARVASIRWPRLEGFFSVDRDISDARVDQKFINGERYQFKLLDQKALFPLHGGEIPVGPIEVEVEMSTSPFLAAESRTLKTRPQKIQVLELSAEGRPADFHRANVGRYTLHATVDDDEVALNQPVTLSITVRGTGNIQQIRPPELAVLPNFKRFDPSVDVQSPKKGREVRGTKTVEHVLVPLASGKQIIPPLSFSFFDPEDGKYRTLQTEPITIQVAPSQGTEPGASTGREVNLLAGAFKPIRFESELSGYGAPPYQRSWFAPVLLLPPGLVLALFLIGVVRGVARSESPRSRSRRAWGRARAKLKAAAALAGAGRAEEFFSRLKAGLLDAVEARCGAPVQALTLSELSGRLQQGGIPAEVAEALVREIENCDFGRFAPAPSRGGEMRASLERAGKMLRLLRRESRPAPRSGEERP